MRDSPAPSAAAASVTALCPAPPSSRADVFLPGTAGDCSLSASLSACTLLYEVPSRTGARDSQPASQPAGGRSPPAPQDPPGRGRRRARGGTNPHGCAGCSGCSRVAVDPASSLWLGGSCIKTVAGNV